MLTRFRVRVMGNKLCEMVEDESYDRYTFEERMEILTEAEASVRRDRKVPKFVFDARFKLPSACVEDIMCLRDRRLSRDRVARLASCDWAESCEVVVIISKTGCGKSFPGQVLANAACRRLFSVRYARLADIMDDLNRCRAAADESYYQRTDAYKTVQLFIVDDFMATPVTTQNAVDLFETMEPQEGCAATLIALRLEANEWYLRIEGELMADSVLNRITTGPATSIWMDRTCASTSRRGGIRRDTRQAYHRYRRWLTSGTISADCRYQMGLLLTRDIALGVGRFIVPIR